MNTIAVEGVVDGLWRRAVLVGLAALPAALAAAVACGVPARQGVAAAAPVAPPAPARLVFGGPGGEIVEAPGARRGAAPF